MKKKFLGKLVALTLVAAMAFTGCGKQPEEAKTDDGAATETTETTLDPTAASTQDPTDVNGGGGAAAVIGGAAGGTASMALTRKVPSVTEK